MTAAGECECVCVCVWGGGQNGNDLAMISCGRHQSLFLGFGLSFLWCLR
jgi:hypothetical protein